MIDITPQPDPKEDPQHIPSEEKRQKEISQPEITDSSDARDPSRVPPQKDPQNPAHKPADEQEVEALEVEKGLEWAEDDKHIFDRKSHASE
jgi:hypothetical protein